MVCVGREMTREEILQIAKPMLFNTDMVWAILGDRKTATRRLINPRHLRVLNSPLHKLLPEIPDNVFIKNLFSPYKSGDILYVRETWAFMPCIGCNGDYARPGSGMNCYDTQAVEYDDGESISDGCFIYRADCKTPERIVWRPSIHMPKKAARIWLKVTDVRAERLQDIAEEQAETEGITKYSKDGKLYKYAVSDDWWIEFHKKHRKSFAGNWWQDMPKSAKTAFSYLWDSTIKKKDLSKHGWDANPWVWVIEFERCEKPEKIDMW